MTKKKYFLLGIISVGLFIGVICLFLYLLVPSYDKTKCYDFPELEGFGPGFSDATLEYCLGYIYIYEDTKCSDDEVVTWTQCGDTYIHSDLIGNYITYKSKKYKFLDNVLYVIGPLAVDIDYYDGVNKRITFGIKEGEGYNFIDFQNESDIPKYIVVDTETTDIEFYKTLEEMDEQTRKIFKELESE